MDPSDPPQTAPAPHPDAPAAADSGGNLAPAALQSDSNHAPVAPVVANAEGSQPAPQESPGNPASPPGGEPAPKPKNKGGRPKGSRNKKVLEREERARLDALQLEKFREIEGDASAAARMVQRAERTGIKLAKDVLNDFMQLFAGMAAVYQPLPPGVEVPPGRQPNESKFREYAVLAKETAAALAPFQSPRYSAVMVGATIVNKIEVSGGMPDDYAPPAPGPATFAALTVIEAEDDDGSGTPSAASA